MDISQLSEKDKMLWKQAKKRVDFRKHLFTYIVINALVWGMFLLRPMHHWDNNDGNMQLHMHHYFFPWPVFMTLGWGVGLAFNYYSAYHENKYTAVEKEFEKLKNSGK